MLRILALALSLSVCLTTPSAAQTNQRTLFNESVAEFNNLIMAGKLGTALSHVRSELEMDEAEIAAVNEKLQSLYEGDFVGHATVRSETLKGGFRQEMIGYWTEKGEYFYVYFLLHTRETGGNRDVLEFRYGTDFNELHALF
ncbi:hypothetical protein ACS3QZ_04560 [Shimia sp. W99]